MAAIRCVFDGRKMKGGIEPPWHHRAPSSRIRRDDAVAAGDKTTTGAHDAGHARQMGTKRERTEVGEGW